MPARSRLLVIAACIAAALAGLPAAAHASDTKQINTPVEACTNGIATKVIMWITDLSEHEASSISVGVQTASSWMNASLSNYNNDDETGLYIVDDPDAMPRYAQATVPQAWDGDFELKVDCADSEKPDVTVACDFDGVDPKVLNVKVRNPNSAKTGYTVTALRTSGTKGNRQFAEEQLDVLADETEEVDFEPIYDNSSYRITVIGSDGSMVIKNIRCGLMPSSADSKNMGPGKGPGSIGASPVVGRPLSPTVAPTIPSEVPAPKQQQMGARDKKPVSSFANPPAILGIAGIVIGIPVLIILGLWIANRKKPQKGPGNEAVATNQ